MSCHLAIALHVVAAISPRHDLLQRCAPIIYEVDVPGSHNAQQPATKGTCICHTNTAEVLRQLQAKANAEKETNSTSG